MNLRVLHLYRPRLPSTRAQSIQVLGTCHGLASLGYRVTLLADAPVDNMPVEDLPTVDQVLDFYDLPPVEGLDLKLAPTSIPSAMSFWFRKHVLFWLWDAIRHHPDESVILGRSKRYIDEYLVLPFGPPVVLEAHEVDSEIARQGGSDERRLLKLEQRLLAEVDGLVTNCAGTMQLLREVHGDLLLPPNQKVVHNATNARRVRNHLPGAETVVGYAGSLRAFKGVSQLVELARRLPPGHVVEVMGGSTEEIAALGVLPENLRILGDLPYREVPDRLARWHAAVICLDDNLFGARLANPLKVWDYLAVGMPIVAADLPTVREVLSDEVACFYRAGDADSMAQAVLRATEPSHRFRARRRRLRSWRARAEDLRPVLEGCLQ
ncbi:MAG: glycosyltransferase family 4 protein [Proteobacteria bacterium]|nr:glycosyltransferase family 4 protein [Pseudomonadota bacterium]MCP4920665.1 glycosyltransferase family 4 protein [Pseudomonadota bacterium]